LAVLTCGPALLHAQPPGAVIQPPAITPPSANAQPAPGMSPGQKPDLPATRPASPIVRQGDLLRLTRNVPGDAKPILVDADEISTWNDEGVIVLLLRGQVLVQQSVSQTRFQEGVAWVDLQRYKATGIMHLDLYAEGQVRVDTSIEIQDAARAVLDLNTRGEFHVRAHRGKVNRQERSGDPLVARAHGMGVGIRRPAAPPAPVSPVAPTTPASEPGPPPPASVLPPVPGAPSATPWVPTPGTTVPDSPAATPGANVPGSPGTTSGSPGTTHGSPGATPGANPPGSPGSQVKQSSFSSHGLSGDRGAAATAALVLLVQALVPPPDGPPSASPGSAVPPQRGPPESPPPVPPPIPPIPESQKQQMPPGGDPASPPGPAPEVPSRSGASPVQPVPPVSTPAVPGPPPLPPSSPPRQHRILPRSNKDYDLEIKEEPPGSGNRVIIVTGGIILNVRNVPGADTLDVEADRAVVWSKSSDPEQTANNLRSEQGESSSKLEFYLAGHVVMRTQKSTSKEKTVVEAEELYYDTNRSVMIALNSRSETRTDRFALKAPQFTEPIIFVTPELIRTSEITYEFSTAQIFSSKLSSDPGLIIYVGKANVEENRRIQKNILGQPVIDPRTKQPLEITESILTARNVFFEFDGVPFFYLPYYKGDARDPLGPLESISVGYSNTVFGFEAGVGLNVYKLLGIVPPDGHHWRINLDYMSRRGPSIGNDYDYTGRIGPSGPDVDDPLSIYTGTARLYGMYDQATDVLGGNRPNNNFVPSDFRGRAFWRNSIFDLPGGFTIQSQISVLSDRNYLEQYFKREFDADPNQATFVYFKQSQENWAYSVLVEPRIRNWVTETEWLPRLDAYLIGQSFFDRLTYNGWASIAFARLRPSNDTVQPLYTPSGGTVPGVYEPPVGFETSSFGINTARLSLMQELAYPLQLGAFKVVPYVKGDIAGYTEDLQNNAVTRVWGGGGVRASIPFTRLFCDVQSELFNLQGLNHKIVASANYFYADTNVHYNRLPELDRLNDDASEQMLRDIKPQEPLYNPGAGLALATSKLFDPQMFAIRTLIDNRLETLDHIDVLQLDLRQRLQTKRGFPGSEHIVDWMILETSVSFFPEPSKDNFGKPFAFAQYYYQWNIGDRTTFESSGWYDPETDGPRIFTVGFWFNRPDRTSYYIGYRQIDPLQSRTVTASVSYAFSPKYSMTFTSSYDFGTSQSQVNSLLFTRTGTDLQVAFGFNYNAFQNNFGVILQIVPNVVPMNRSPNLGGAAGGSGLLGR
jgi:hypothetical protein